MRWNKNGYTVTVRINLFAVGDGGGDLCTADPGSSHADIACFVVDTLADVICDPQLPQALLATLVSTTIAAVGALLIALLVIVALWAWAEMAAYVRPSAVAARHSPCGFCHQRPAALC